MSWYKMIRERLENREDSEHRQALLRIFLQFSFLCFFLCVDSKLGTSLCTIYLPMSCLLFVWIIISPEINVTRRVIGILIDLSGISLVLHFTEEIGALAIAIYPIVIIGSGTRYGNKYLLATVPLAFFFFLWVVTNTPFWLENLWFSASGFLLLLIVPLYVFGLIHKLNLSTQEAICANNAKTDFLAVMSHELRTPLHGIIGLQDLLKKELTDIAPQQKQHLALAQHSAHLLSHLIDDILDLSKIESGSIDIEPTTFKLKDFFCDILFGFVPKANEKNIALILKLDDVPVKITTDEARLRQVLLNIIGNAQKFTSSGEINIRVYQHDGKLYIDVKDTGTGISEKYIEKIFNPFTQVSSDTDRKGTGLGTTIALKFTELMGGTISVQSKLGYGSTFTINICLNTVGAARISEQILVNDVEITTSLTEDEVNASKLKKLKFLLAEDDPIARFLVVECLSEKGLNIEAVDNGLLAWNKIQQNYYDVLITDIRMPGLNGIELTKKIRENESDHTIHIIGLSADVMKDVIDNGKKAGMNNFISKPISSNHLMRYLVNESGLIQ